MEVHLAPELQAQLDQLANETGCPPEKFIEDALAWYMPEFAESREMLDRRYDDLKSGRVKPIGRDEVAAHFRDRSAARRSTPGS